ncbi:hypothetical protein [Amphritea sp.]
MAALSILRAEIDALREFNAEVRYSDPTGYNSLDGQTGAASEPAPV